MLHQSPTSFHRDSQMLVDLSATLMQMLVECFRILLISALD